jgi:hypothetical protein
MSEGNPTHLRRRALSVAASTLVVGVACVLLVLSSRTSSFEPFRPNVIDVVITPNPERLDLERPQQRQPQRANAPASTSTQPNAPASADQQQLSSMLACFRPRGRRPAHCPEEPAPNSDDPRTQLPVGGDFYQPPPPDLDRIYTRAERDTIVMPSCVRDGPPPTGGAGVSVCAPFGTTPPPPSRSAEQICRDANMGGPCETPPFREEDVVRRRSN